MVHMNAMGVFETKKTANFLLADASAFIDRQVFENKSTFCPVFVIFCDTPDETLISSSVFGFLEEGGRVFGDNRRDYETCFTVSKGLQLTSFGCVV